MKWIALLGAWPLVALLLGTAPLPLFADESGAQGAVDAPGALDDPNELDELDDVLGGFEDEESEAFDVDVPDEIFEEETPFFDFDGSVEFSPSVNYLSHSAPGPNGPVSYTGVSRLRTRLNLQLDLELPRDFEVRVSPYIWYDFSYILRGISEFTDQVIDEYEWEGDFQESYLQGPLLENLDLKIGRQVVNWGRSDSLRVLDILNPLDNREPGRADIEDLRWAIGMAKLDYYWGPWTFTAVAIPEMRFDDLPPVGSDFNPSPIRLPPTRKPNSFRDWEFAGRIDGTFEGWDFSVQGAWFFEDIARLGCNPSPCEDLSTDLRFKHDRLIQAGAGANYTFGSWLFKAEAASLYGQFEAAGQGGLDFSGIINLIRGNGTET